MNLSGLTIGSLNLTPSFDKNVTEYTATTLNATNKVTAVAEDEEANIEIKVNGVEIDNETSATWIEGENTVSIVVTNGENTKAYRVEVTYYPEVEFEFDPVELTADTTYGLSSDTVTVEGTDIYTITVDEITTDNEHITATYADGIITVACDDDTIFTEESMPYTVTVKGHRDNNPATGTIEIVHS